jgi:hypothetical protein
LDYRTHGRERDQQFRTLQLLQPKSTRTHACSQLLQFPSLLRLGRQEEFFSPLSTPRCSAVLVVTVRTNHAEEKRVFSVAGLVAAGPSESETYEAAFLHSSSRRLASPPASLVNSEAGVRVRTMEFSGERWAGRPSLSSAGGLLRSMPRTPVLAVRRMERTACERVRGLELDCRPQQGHTTCASWDVTSEGDAENHVS